MLTTSDDRVLRPHHAVRHVAAGSDAPWPGLLVRTEAGESRLLVDSALLGSHWKGWSAARDGHLLAPIDVSRRVGGHDVVLPAFRGTVAALIALRAEARLPFTPGEAVTLAVSVLRGLSELDGEWGDLNGCWWLTDAGRPVLATDLGTAPLVDETRALLDAVDLTLGDDDLGQSMRRLIGRADAPAREVALLEARLFAVADAEPLADASLAPRRSRLTEPMTIAQARRTVDDDPLMRAQPPGAFDALLRHVDADVGDVVSRVTTGVWRRLRAASPAPRRRVWGLAGCAAVAVIAAGMLWPGDTGPVAAETPPAPGRAAATGTAPTVDEPGADLDEPPASSEPGDAVPDPASAASALLSARSACGGATECLRGVLVDPAAVFPAGVADLPAIRRTVTLLDDFGGVAVVRIEALEGTADAQLAVVQREEDEWLLRDVYVAQQP